MQEAFLSPARQMTIYKVVNLQHNTIEPEAMIEHIMIHIHHPLEIVQLSVPKKTVS
jgi:Ran GTPase-activating protein (RanGAP) involved in mRNA processing and transport